MSPKLAIKKLQHWIKTIMQHVNKSMIQDEAVNVIKNNVLSCCIISNGIWSPWALFLINFDQFVNKTTITSLCSTKRHFLWLKMKKIVQLFLRFEFVSQTSVTKNVCTQ